MAGRQDSRPSSAANSQPDSAQLPLVAFLGNKLVSHHGDVPVSSLAAPNKVIGVYFSASWCPPCKAFTPKLASVYNAFKSSGHPRRSDWEVVLVSADKDEVSFLQYYRTMPWLALPYNRRDIKDLLKAMFKVKGYPALVLLDGPSGELITADGRNAVTADPSCSGFPWGPLPLSALLRGLILVDHKGGSYPADRVLAGKFKLFFFAAGWSKECAELTPLLVGLTRALQAAGRLRFEVVYVSGDRTEPEFREAVQQLPPAWLHIPWVDLATKKALAARFSLNGIPSLAIVDAEGATIRPDACHKLVQDPQGRLFPWYPGQVRA